MILNFSFENFGSIKDKQTLSFEADHSKHLEKELVITTAKGVRLLKLALIYGANASGKSTVLKAIDFLRELVLSPVATKSETLDFEPFLFDDDVKNKTTLLSAEFIQNDIKYAYEVAFSQIAIVSEVLFFYNPNKAVVYKRSTDLDNQYTLIEFGSKIKNEKVFENALAANTLWNNTVLGGYLKTNIEQLQLKEVVDWFRDYLNKMVESGTDLPFNVAKLLRSGEVGSKDIVSILKQADFNITNIFFDRENTIPDEIQEVMKASDLTRQFERLIAKLPKKIFLEHQVNGKVYELPIQQESEGTRRYFEFAGLLCLLIKKSMAVPIDELESSLHPDLYTHFLLSFLINSERSQLIATTHNREILNSRDIFRDDCIWFTDKSKNSGTELYSLAEFESSVVRDTTNVLNAYKSGKLGGAPNLGDYYIHLDK